MNAPESFSNLACFNTILYFGKPTQDETRWPLAQNNNKPAEVLHLKRESDEKSVHLQALQILHILCFTDVNYQTETHFFLVKFLSSSSEYMNQTRQVFEFLTKGRYESKFTGQLVKFRPITVEIKLVKPIKFAFAFLTSITRAFAIRSPLAFLPCLREV